MYLEGGVPPIRCFLREEYMYNEQEHVGGFVEVVLVGVRVVQNRALAFRVMTNRGVMFNGMPINALTTDREAEHLPLDMCQLWDNFSYNFTVVNFPWLREKKCEVMMKDKTKRWGQHQFTISYCHSDKEDLGMGYGEDPDVKDAHIILLDSGQLLAQPNNRLLWHDFDFVTDRLKWDEKIDYKVMTEIYYAEHSTKWRTENSDKYFYNTVEEKA